VPGALAVAVPEADGVSVGDIDDVGVSVGVAVAVGVARGDADAESLTVGDTE
jgi:hypothetical protein